MPSDSGGQFKNWSAVDWDTEGEAGSGTGLALVVRRQGIWWAYCWSRFKLQDLYSG